MADGLCHCSCICNIIAICWLAVALAFRAQMVEEVPVGENDRNVDLIVTADGTIAASAKGAAAMS